MEGIERLRKSNEELRARDEAVYLRLKDRPSVKKLIALGGLCAGTAITMLDIEKIDALFSQGWSYREGYSSDITCALAFLLHLEETFNTEITSAKQLQELAQFSAEHMPEIETFYYEALERRYVFALGKILRGGGKYKDLLALTPGCFGLPDKWENLFGMLIIQQDIIHQAIANYIEDDWTSHIIRYIQPPSPREIADNFEAPYLDVLIAARYYSV